MKVKEKKEKYFLLMEVAKWASLLLIVPIIVSFYSVRVTSKEPWNKVLEASCKYSDSKDMQVGDNQMIRRLYGLDPSDFDDIKLYYPKTNMGASELLLVKLRSVDQQNQVEEAAEGRKDTQRENFDGYGQDQTAMIKNSIIDVKGNYVLFISSKNSSRVKIAFEKALKGKTV